MNQGLPVFTHSVIATAVLTPKRAVNAAGAIPAAGATCLGPVRACDGIIGERAPVDMLGSAPWESGGVFSVGAYLELDSVGRVVVFSAGVKVGKALEASTGSGQFPEVFILQN